MVCEAPPQPQQQPIMRDFMGLGKLAAADDQTEGENLREEPYFSSASGINLDSTGATYCMLNMGSSIEHKSSLRKTVEARYLEGSAETVGLSCPRGWQGMVVQNSARLDANVKPSAMQLTIFYGGHVNVYNNIPVDRAEAIMQLAAKGDSLPLSAPTAPFGVSRALAAPGFFQPAKVAENLGFNAQMGPPIHFAADQASQNGPPAKFECAMPNTPSTATSPQPVVPRALPLARKASLARFLEKRKERMQMMAPYFKKQMTPAQGDQIVGSVQNVTLSELYDQYFRRQSMLYSMQEQTDMSSCGIPAKD